VAESITIYQSTLIGGTSYSPVYDLGNTKELVLFSRIDDWAGTGTLTLTIQHSNDGVNWLTKGTIDFDAVDETETTSYSSGLMEKLRIKATPDPLPWEVDGVKAVLTLSALLRTGN